MSAAVWTVCALLVVFAAMLAGPSALAWAGAPAAGGTVPSVLSLSLGKPTRFTRAGRGNLYTATVRAAVTSTESSTRLSLSDGKTTTRLRRWSEPVSNAAAKIRLRQRAPSACTLRNRRKLLFVALTAGVP